MSIPDTRHDNLARVRRLTWWLRLAWLWSAGVFASAAVLTDTLNWWYWSCVAASLYMAWNAHQDLQRQRREDYQP
jgi:hypothetical protein